MFKLIGRLNSSISCTFNGAHSRKNQELSGNSVQDFYYEFETFFILL